MAVHFHFDAIKKAKKELARLRARGLRTTMIRTTKVRLARARSVLTRVMGILQYKRWAFFYSRCQSDF
ncbi:MAG: hypothetical protein HS115_06125 [Spirochaetales bacterium]|nr:hypothetical protein [Spirochaetales bacterium]